MSEDLHQISLKVDPQEFGRRCLGTSENLHEINYFLKNANCAVFNQVSSLFNTFVEPPGSWLSEKLPVTEEHLNSMCITVADFEVWGFCYQINVT